MEVVKSGKGRQSAVSRDQFAEGRTEWRGLPVAGGMLERALVGMRGVDLGISVDGRPVIFATAPIRTRRGLSGAVIIGRAVDAGLIEETARPLGVAMSINARLGSATPGELRGGFAAQAQHSGVYSFPIALSGESRGTARLIVSVPTDGFDAATRSAVLMAGGLGLIIAATLSLLNAILLESAVTRPLRALRSAIQQVRQGDYALALEPRGSRELQEVAEGFTRMASLVDEQHKRLEGLASTDPLTGLANHRHFHESLGAELSRASRAGSTLAVIGSTLAVIALDLDHFKDINDTYGHPQGDEVLRCVSEHLRELVRPFDVVARLGGEEFALLLPGLTADEAARIAERAREAVAAASAPPHHVTCSVGVACFPSDARDGPTLVQLADAALYEAKSQGRNRVLIFSELENTLVVTPARTRALLELLTGAPPAIAFQPIWELADGGQVIIGFEALARPHTDELSGPAEAFEIAERSGRVHELDARCRQATLARAHELPAGTLLFMNVAPPSLSHDDLAGDALLREVRAAGLDPGQVVLEITERSAMQLDRVVREATRLRQLGFKLALDDVGAGNAGLEMLRMMPVDFVKIDREVIAGSEAGGSARAVLLAIIAFAAEVGAFVIAEGIETEAMLEHVRLPPTRQDERVGRGVQGVQGYLLGRPSLILPETLEVHDGHAVAPHADFDGTASLLAPLGVMTTTLASRR